MKWTEEAESAVQKVPFFVRKKVRARVEAEAVRAGKSTVTLTEVKTAQARYLASLSKEVRGYQLDACFGPSGCPNRAVHAERLLEKLEKRLREAELLAFLKQSVEGDLKPHHEFRISIAECPNACSQPQIKDIGIIGALHPVKTDEPCNGCNECVEACHDAAISVPDADRGPTVDPQLCLSCGRCVAVCPTGTLGEGPSGYRVLLAGKLGRHPRLARPLPGIHSEARVEAIVQACLDLYKQRSRNGMRFANLFTEADFNEFSRRFETPGFG